MAISTYESDFWRWYFQRQFDEFEGLTPHQRMITNLVNIFREETSFDLFINLEDGICHDSENNRFTISEYIARRLDFSVLDVERDLEVEYEKWKGTRELEFAQMRFIRDAENCCWYMKTPGASKDGRLTVTEFDIILDSIIERWNIKTQSWERYYEGKLRYKKLGRIIHKEFKMSPGQTHSKSEFSKAVWEKDFLEVVNMKDDDVRSFWAHVDYYWKPRIVREFNHSGFIEFEGKTYFLAENVLIKFPINPGQSLELVAEKEGAFPVQDNKYVKPPESAAHLPHFDLGVPDPKSGLYLKKMNMLLKEEDFSRKLREVEEHFCKMVGGDKEFGHWGRLILAYTFSYIFFDEIYKLLNHIIFLYLYGEGNVGKGEIAKRILDFWGMNYLDSLNTPTARIVDVNLEIKSKIPLWVDEHVPEVPGKKAAISDQTWNSWFELKQRPTSMQKDGVWGTENKEVRTMPLFCSNFKPRTDHLLSRSLIMEYKKSIRGPEKHLQWLKAEKELLQLLTLSFMQHYNLMNRNVFIWDLDRLRSSLKRDVKNELKIRNVDHILQDRQISQFATLLTVYHWLDNGYRNVIEDMASQSQEAEREDNPTHRKLLQENIEMNLKAILQTDLYNFVKNEVVKTSIVAAQYDPLTDYIETIGTLIQAGRIKEKAFNWTSAGHLKIYTKAIWDEYEYQKRGTDDMVRREVVEEKIKNLFNLPDDAFTTINWKDSKSGETIRCRGLYLKNAIKHELFRNNFNWEKYGDQSLLGGNESETEQWEDDDSKPPF